MQSLNLSVRFEVQPCKTFAIAYVNDVSVGRVRFYTIKGKRKLTFRCSQNPCKNVVRCLWPESFEALGLEETLQNRRILEQLIPIVIRNALVNRGILNNLAADRMTDEPYSFVKAA